MRSHLLVACVLVLAGCGNGKRLDARPGVPTSIAAAAFHARGLEVQATPRRDPYPAPAPGMPDVMMPDDPFGLPPGPAPSGQPPQKNQRPSSPTHL